MKRIFWAIISFCVVGLGFSACMRLAASDPLSGNPQSGGTPGSANPILTVAGAFWPTLGAGENALFAQLNAPTNVLVDISGNLYIADSANNTVRKVAVSGIITNVAGNGTKGYSGDSGLADAAQLNFPAALALDSSNNLYIADEGNSVIRKVAAATGTISTIAGTGSSGFGGDGALAVNAKLNLPYGVAVDSVGNVYISDTGNNLVRKITAGTGIIHSVAGNGTAGFSGDGGAATSAEINQPRGLTTDANSNVYIVDSSAAIRKLNPNTGIITTIAGNGTQGYSGDGGQASTAQLERPIGIALDASGDLFIADEQSNTIRRVDATTSVITTFAGINGQADYSGDTGAATSAEINAPYGVATDNTGNVYIADTNNQVIRRVRTNTGIISTIAGNNANFYAGNNGPATSAELNNPESVALDSNGNLYIADTDNNVIRRVSASDGVITVVAGTGVDAYGGDDGPAINASLCAPKGLSIDARNNLYFADGCFAIRKITASNGFISTIAGTGTSGYSGDNNLAVNAQVTAGQGTAIDSNGNLYFADTNNHVIRKINANNIFTVAGFGVSGYSGDEGPATNASLKLPSTVVVDANDNLYIADTGNNVVRKVTANNGFISTIAGTGTVGRNGDGGLAIEANLFSPSGLWLDGSGSLFIADTGNSRIQKLDMTTGIIVTVAGTFPAGYTGDGGNPALARLNNPMGMAMDASGNLYFADSVNNLIRKFLP